MSGKYNLPCRPARGDENPAHIGEAFLSKRTDGNPEGSPSDPVTTDPKGEAHRVADEAAPRRRVMRNTPALIARQGAYEDVVQLEPWYVSGLADGEGCFCVSLAVRSKLRTGIEVRPSFALSLNERDLELIMALQTFFGCGWIRESKSDRTFKYEARSIGDLVGRIVPHFERYPLRGIKARSFEGFARVCRMVWQGDHLRQDGLRDIIGIAYEMNLGRRRLSQDALLRVLGEVKG